MQENNTSDACQWPLVELNASAVASTFRLMIQTLVRSIRDLLFSRGPSVSRQRLLPRKQAVAQQLADELNPELIIDFLGWSRYNI